MTRNAKARRKFPALLKSKSGDPAVNKLIEVLEIGLGDRGNELDQFVTRRDVQEGYRVQGTRIIRTGGGGSVPPTTVTALSNLVAMGSFRFINLAWEGINQDYYSYTEIWRPQDDNLGNAVLVGTTRASVYSDPVGSNETWYYWIRAVSTSGDPGPWNDTNGTMGQSALDPDYIIGELEGQIGESELAEELLTPIQAIPGIQTTVGDHSAAISILQQGVDDNYAAIQLKASTSVVDDLEQDIQNISAQFTLKLDVNGYVSGIGLMNDGATSQFIVASDAVYFIDPGQSITQFNPNTNYSSIDALRDTQFVFGYAEVEGQKRFAINVPAYIPEAYIQDAMVENLSADKLFAAEGTLAEAIIGDAEITNAMITNTLRSNNYQAGVSGWIIQKSGYMELNNLLGRGTLEGSKIIGSQIEGSVIVGTAYVAPTELDNNANIFLGFQRNMSYSWQQDIGRSWYYSPYIDIVSANNSDTDNYRRFRRHWVTIDADAVAYLGNSGTLRVQFYQGGSLVGDTGYQSAYFPDQVSRSGQNGYVSWEFTNTQYPSRLRATLHFPYDGNGRIRVRFYIDMAVNPDYGRRYATVQTTAENDY